ncbi:GWT1-domain-containing protein [Boletus reticuloceps]|uniref:GPI-anchored wall transfer protein n=1 Tax=Boletus reticuloceps TaxID=495285 RepID=A0A8I3AFA6_9AGAM|nr:GWT1-domain-containing protein [Boletus reticuloceps]
MDNNYKASKEAFVSGMIGSSVFHVNVVSAVGLVSPLKDVRGFVVQSLKASMVLHSTLRTRLTVFRAMPFVLEWLVLALPMSLALTVYADAPGALSALLLAPTCVLLLLPPIESGTPLLLKINKPQPTATPRESSTIDRSAQPALRPLPALTTYRANMMLMTVFSILAVDFPVFPRSLAKCETYGVSLMDVGVGSFVFSQGIVSAIPLIKDPFQLHADVKPKLYRIIKKILPIVVLGIVRVLLVKGTEYPEHVTEYGAHWNFFLTLSILPVAEVALHPVIKYVPISLLGLWIAVLHQFALSFMGLEAFLLKAPRSNIIYANKEGLISLLGYLSLHIMGLSLGTIILPPSPSFFRKQQRILLEGGNSEHLTKLDPSVPRQNAKITIELFSYALVWWTLLALVQHGLQVSRRMANLPYTLWIVAYNTSFILAFYLLDMIFFPTRISKLKDPFGSLR